MPEMIYSVSDIKELMQALNKNKISGLKIESGDFRLEINGAKTEPVLVAPASIPTTVSAVAEASADDSEAEANIVKSPIVGTFYASPAPDRDSFVKVGSQVKKGDVLFIIESMKLMNEVTSEFDGTVTAILVDNAQGVEYGQPIMRVE